LNPFVKNGACFTSGAFDGRLEPQCVQGNYKNGIGCRYAHKFLWLSSKYKDNAFQIWNNREREGLSVFRDFSVHFWSMGSSCYDSGSNLKWLFALLTFFLGWMFVTHNRSLWMSTSWSRRQFILDHRGNKMWLQRFGFHWIWGRFSLSILLKGGVLQNRWTWTKGEWQGGIPRPLQWTAANTISTYSYSPRLSFILLSNWTAMR